MSADIELDTLVKLKELVEPFTKETRSRMWRWVTARLDADMQEAELLVHLDGPATE